MERFLIIELDTVSTSDGDGSNPGTRASMRMASERQVSDRIDMADCYGDAFKVFYLGDAGELLPVTTANFQRLASEDDQIMYAMSDLIAGGQIVGTLHHSSH